MKPLTARQKELIAEGVGKSNEAEIKTQLGVKQWIDNEDFLTSLAAPRVAADDQHPRAWSAAIPVPAARRCCRGAPRRSSTSGWFPT